MTNINNLNIVEFKTLIKPNNLKLILGINEEIYKLVSKTRKEIEDILNRKSNKKIFIIGPCSIHNIEEAKDYGRKLFEIYQKVKSKILIVMRVYFEKPRTTIGWKGLINDPDLNNTFNVNKGLRLARELLIYLNSIGLPCACEFLDVITPQYISDLISWGAIGARTTESQVHRQLSSGLSMPIGFKNGTKGSVELARDAIISASHQHCFMAITDDGEPAISTTKGNKNCHIILRGGVSTNYSEENVKNTASILKDSQLIPNIMVDCSHGNSNKNYKNQEIVLYDIVNQIINKEENIIGLMLESNINEGKQELNSKNYNTLEYGVSITDSCISIEETDKLVNYAFDKL